MSEETRVTPLNKRCEILADLWIKWGQDPEFTEFVEYCDLALPLAYAINSNIIAIDYDNERLNDLIDEAFELLVEGLKVEDQGFESLEDLHNKTRPE
jgi:hypothetical protein